MVNNSTNINKNYNYLSLQSIEHKNTNTYDIGIPGSGLGQPQKCGRV